MKKLTSLLLICAVTVTAILIGAISVSAFLGPATQVVANDVNMIKTGLLGQKLTFNDSDFKSALCLTDFDTITITEIPASTEGTLLLNGRRVGKGRVIKRKNLATLVFTPASKDVTECSFKFTVDGYAAGAEIECIMKFIDKVNYAPKASDTENSASLKTQESIKVYGNLTAIDPEGDKLNYMIVSYPKRGVVELCNSETGRFSYTPKDGYTGNDNFSYVARDEYGNYSTLTSVTVKVNSRMCDTVYRDMEDREEYNAAVALTAMGIMDGRLIGDDTYFLPDENVSRAEFVTMAMKCAGIRVDTTIAGSYFDDNSDIPTSLQGYIATAQRIGIINGDFSDGKLVFRPNDTITRYEAAKVLSSIIGISEDEETKVFAEDYNVPVWARAGVYTMCSLGIFTEADSATLSNPLTRADTANYLYKMIEKM